MNDFEQLVSLVTKRVMEKLEESNLNQQDVGKTIYILGEQTVDLTRKLAEAGYYVVTEPEANSSLFLTTLSIGRLGRIALMTPNNDVEELILAQLLEKKEVLVNLSGRTYSAGLKNSPYSMKKKISQYEDEWQQFGAIFVQEKVDRQKSKLLSVKQLQQKTKDGSQTISVTKDTIITPLAIDFIRENQLTLINE